VLLAAPFLVGTAVASQYPQAGGGRHMGERGHGGPPSAEQRLKHMSNVLNLTGDQQAKIKPILKDEQKKMEDARNSASGDRHAIFEKFQQIQDDTAKQIRPILDDTQKKKFDEMEKERRERREKMHNRQPGPPPKE
jgi:Spy/CpxP family protein refolding chaperone